MEGRTLSHFRITARIGAGGMGVVYEAEDVNLRRRVALKVLPPEVTGDAERRARFLREARAAAAVTHPNIATMYEVGEADGVIFIAMELVEGKTLRDLIGGRAMPMKDVLRVGGEIAEGLARAHQAGIVHRDLKPDNVIVGPDGHPKILDFGLARRLQERAAVRDLELSRAATISEEMTTAGRVLGTTAYMSPEQARGEPADTRSDLFSFGVTLYEMVTGVLPFKGKTGADVLSAIIRDAPSPPSQVNPSVPPELDRIIDECLEKDPRDRYQHADQLVVDLGRLKRTTDSGARMATGSGTARPRRRVGALAGAAAIGLGAVAALLFAWNVGGIRERLWGGAAAGRIESIAVLPLENLSHDPEQEYFADGMTEVLITDLARISTLRVISRTSVMSFKGARGPMPAIGRRLGVDAVVEGAVLRSGERVRITAQLVEAATDRHLWASTYERDVRDVLRLQAEVAEAIARGIQARLTPQEQARLRSSRSVDPEAYQDYLKGRYFQSWRTEEGSRRSLEHFQRAIERDPTYALAYVGLSDTYQLLSFYGVLPPGEAHLKAKAAVQKALEIDGSLAEGRTSLAGFLFGEWDWAGAEREFKGAIELNPNYARAHHWYAEMLMDLGRLDESLTEIRRAQELDPLSPIIAMTGGQPFYYVSRDYDRAIEQYRKALELDPKFVITHGWLGLAYMEKKEYEAAIAEIQKAIDLSGRDPMYLAFLCQVRARAGERDTAQRLLGELLDRSKERYVSPWDIALTYASLGESDQAFAFLEKGYQERADLMVGLKVDPRLDSLRSHPRFKDLLRRVGLPPD